MYSMLVVYSQLLMKMLMLQKFEQLQIDLMKQVFILQTFLQMYSKYCSKHLLKLNYQLINFDLLQAMFLLVFNLHFQIS